MPNCQKPLCQEIDPLVTPLLAPDPRIDHVSVVEFQRAMLLAGTASSVVNVPPAMMSPSGSTASALTDPMTWMPEPIADHAPVEGV